MSSILLDLEKTPASRRAATDGPRERLRGIGPEALSDAELVALVLRTGVRGADAFTLARDLLERCDGLLGLRRWSVEQLLQSHGLGEAKASSLAAALEMGRRLATRKLEMGASIRSAEDVYRHFHARLRDAEREVFMGLLLDGRHRVVREFAISSGTLTASLVHPREVFQIAVRESAAALVLVHNHPSGDAAPSPEDRLVTRRLQQAGDILGIRVLDHVVVADRGYFSFQEHGELEGSPSPRG